MQRKKVAILISGRGSNMSALLDAAGERDFPAEIVAVISDREDAAGLVAARARNIEARAIPRDHGMDKAAHEALIEQALGELGAEIVCLAGYMRLLSGDFVNRYQGRLINIHPSLLPLFPGLDTHRAALAAGMRVHGCTVHFVTEGTDEGPIIAQAAVAVSPDDTETTLSARVLKAEHQLYPLALRLVIEGKIRLARNKAIIDPAHPAPTGLSDMVLSPQIGAESLDLEALARFTP